MEDPDAQIEEYCRYISALLEFTLIRGRDGLGGLAEYLVKTLCTKGVIDASSAIQRLDLAMNVAASVGPDARVQVRIEIDSVSVAYPCLRPSNTPIFVCSGTAAS